LRQSWRELDYTHSGTGSLFLLTSRGYFFGLFASGAISSRWTFTQTIQLSVAGFGLSLIFIAFSHSFWQVGVCVIVLGFMAGLYLPTGMAKLTELIPSAHWGKGLAVHELGPNFALFFAPLQVEVLLRFFDWRLVLLSQGVPTLGIVAAHRLYAWCWPNTSRTRSARRCRALPVGIYRAGLFDGRR